jgi:ribosome-binding protein aMBF1 (putative translation factor)
MEKDPIRDDETLNERLHSPEAQEGYAEALAAYEAQLGSPVDVPRMLKDARQAQGISQRELAKRSGVKQPHIARLETGKSTARISTLRRLFEALGLELLILRRRIV